MENLVLIFFLLIFSASFSSFETALFSLSESERAKMKDAGGVSAYILKVVQKPRSLLTTVLLGNEVVNVSISILAGGLSYIFMKDFDPHYATLITVGVTTMVILVFGEIVPKNIAVRMPMMVAQVLIIPYLAFSWVVTPFRYIFNHVSGFFVSWFGGDPKASRRLIVEEELRDLLEMGKNEGTLPYLERGLIQNTMDFYDVKVRDAMTPRDMVLGTNIESTYRDVLKIIEKRRFSRLPVYEKDLDFVIGILHVKELLAHDPEDKIARDLQEHLKPFTVVSPDEILDNLLQEFQKKKIHMAIVKESSGHMIGIITLDDIVKRLFHA
ncbi:MAG: HlyC/CorC family transporter [Deltaproteobacteria bacterium]|nr:MAG: HlyC/CorC family transporter [Deltaproteobacteria bacterium]